MKKIFLIIFLASLLFPLISYAGEYIANDRGTLKTVTYEGLVPCGKSRPEPGEHDLVMQPCQFCHFFVMFKGIIDFVLTLVIIIAALMFTIGGFMFFFAGGNPGRLNQAKSILISTIWGLVIIFAAWIIVNTIFMLIGVADWTRLTTDWFKISCPIKF